MSVIRSSRALIGPEACCVIIPDGFSFSASSFSTEFVQMMTAKWTGLALKTKNPSKVSLTSYCKNLHLIILFCINNLNWMFKISDLSILNKFTKRKKKKQLTESACTGLYPHLSVPLPSPISAPSCPIRSQLNSRAVAAQLASWRHCDVSGRPIAFLPRLPVFFHFCSSCMRLFVG